MLDLFLVSTLPALRRLLPSMQQPGAVAMLIAIGLQESRFDHRRQIGGPARGFWQFERIGVTDVLQQERTRPHIARVLQQLRYPADWIDKTTEVHGAIHDNDALAAAIARLKLYLVPARLPERNDPGAGWAQYLDAWRPGKPHAETWDVCFAQAWALVDTRSPS